MSTATDEEHMETVKRLDVTALAELFGATPSALRQTAGERVDTALLDYRELAPDAVAATVREIRDVLDSGVLRPSGSHRHGDWEDGWAENLRDFEASGHDPLALLPKYYHKDRPNRMGGTFVRGVSPLFMYAVSDVFRRWLYREAFTGCRSLHEFGCGTGHNLLILGELFPGVPLYGYDWAATSRRILDVVREHLGLPVTGAPFDFFAPPPRLPLGPDAGVLTFGALEQIGERHEAFLQALLAAGPRVCVHVEGFLELYDASPFDALAVAYHKARNYLSGYLTSLRRLEARGRIEILSVHRQRFGNLFDDPYSHVVWRPR